MGETYFHQLACLSTIGNIMFTIVIVFIVIVIFFVRIVSLGMFLLQRQHHHHHCHHREDEDDANVGIDKAQLCDQQQSLRVKLCDDALKRFRRSMPRQ